LSYFQVESIAAKRARRRAFRTKLVRAFAANVTNTETVSATINGSSALTFLIDSGATYTILPTTSAQSIGFDTSNPTRQQAVTTVTGQTQANVYLVNLKLNDTPAFQAEVLVMDSNLNLLSTEDLSKAYAVTLGAGGTGFNLVPLGQQPVTTPPPATGTPTTPQVPQSTPSSGNVIVDFIRQLYQTLCGMTPKFPVICNSPQTFMITMLGFGLLILMLAFKGMLGGGGS
jgi:predicted aspartyl protease